MYLNQQIINRGIANREAFYFLLDEVGNVIKSFGDLIDSGLISKEENVKNFMPSHLIALFESFVSNPQSKSIKVQLVVCGDEDVEVVECRFGRNGDHIELIANYLLDDSDHTIPLDKLPYPIALVKKDGEITSLNRSFIDYFLDNRMVVKPICIQDIIKTNVLSPEKFNYLRMIESDANSRAVLCHFKGKENNQTFLLNLIPLKVGSHELYLAAVKDLTQFIEVQQNLENQNEQLRQQIQDEFKLNKSYELKLLKKNRLESLGEIASGIFHELNQPLTHLSLKIDNMLDRYQAGAVSEDYLIEKTEQIQRQIQRMRGIIDEMKQFSTVPERKDELVSIKKVLSCALEDVSYMQVEGLILVMKHIENLQIRGSAIELEQVFVNVLTNSIQSLQEKKEVLNDFKPKLKIVIEKRDKVVHICFTDNGMGANEGELKELFKPFYTTKKNVGGTGLGLFIINNLMRKMHGTIELKSRQGKFFKTVLTFPIGR